MSKAYGFLMISGTINLLSSSIEIRSKGNIQKEFAEV